MTAILVSISCLIIFLNTVPRVNDLHLQALSYSKLIRLIGLLVTAGSSVWLGIMVLLPGKPHDTASALLVAGIAAAWSCSPVVGSWWGFTFKEGSDERYKALRRRAGDKERHA